MALDISIDEDDLYSLAASPDAHERAAAAKHLNTPVAVLEELVSDPDSDVKMALALNPNTPPEVLGEWALSKYPTEASTRSVKNPSCPPEVLAEIARGDFDADRQREALRNPSMPVEVLLEFAKSRNEIRREAAAANPSTPPDALERLSTNSKAGVRAWVAQNPSTPPEVLARLLEDDGDIEPLPRHRTPQSMESVAQTAAANPSTPADALRGAWARACEDRDERRLASTVHISLAKVLLTNPSLPGDLVGAAANDPGSPWQSGAMKAARKHLEVLGVDESNHQAQEILLAQEWWTMSPDSDEVSLALAMHGNR